MSIPDGLSWACRVCDESVVGGAETIQAHLAGHGYEPRRWPDGAVAIDMSDVPELLEEQP